MDLSKLLVPLQYDMYASSLPEYHANHALQYCSWKLFQCIWQHAVFCFFKHFNMTCIAAHYLGIMTCFILYNLVLEDGFNELTISMLYFAS